MTAVVLSAAKDLLSFVISSVAPRSGAQSRDLREAGASLRRRESPFPRSLHFAALRATPVETTAARL